MVADLLRRVSDANTLRLEARQIDRELVQLGVAGGTVSPECALSDSRGRQGLPLWRVTERPFIVGAWWPGARGGRGHNECNNAR